uniref:Uncharacterized protein n=1 Tax=Arundo donax TaxID=35708 RepID=A0A0A9ELM4_ARUDO
MNYNSTPPPLLLCTLKVL